MGRNLMRVPRIPELAIFAIFQSIMFVLLFAFVFGGAIPLPGYADPNAYREYLMPGIFAQTIAFAATTTAIGMCEDINKGIVDRFRSLPDGPVGRADRADIRGRRLQRRHPDRADAEWPARRLGRPHLDPGVPAGRPAPDPVRLLHVVDRRLAGHVRADRRGRAAGLVHRHLPDHVHLERVRSTPEPAVVAPAVRRVEPDQHADRIAPDPVGKPQSVRRDVPGLDRARSWSRSAGSPSSWACSHRSGFAATAR